MALAGAISTVVLAELVAFHAARGGRASAEWAWGLMAAPTTVRPRNAKAKGGWAETAKRVMAGLHGTDRAGHGAADTRDENVYMLVAAHD